MNEEPERTTKYVDVTVQLIFMGSYYDADECGSVATGWIDAGLEDRDNLRGWTTRVTSTREVPGDPEGFDA